MESCEEWIESVEVDNKGDRRMAKDCEEAIFALGVFYRHVIYIEDVSKDQQCHIVVTGVLL